MPRDLSLLTSGSTGFVFSAQHSGVLTHMIYYDAAPLSITHTYLILVSIDACPILSILLLIISYRCEFSFYAEKTKKRIQKFFLEENCDKKGHEPTPRCGTPPI